MFNILKTIKETDNKVVLKTVSSMSEANSYIEKYIEEFTKDKGGSKTFIFGETFKGCAFATITTLTGENNNIYVERVN